MRGTWLGAGAEEWGKDRPMIEENMADLSSLGVSHLLLTSEIGILSRAAMSSTVSLPSEMMPTPLAMALAVMG